MIVTLLYHPAGGSRVFLSTAILQVSPQMRYQSRSQTVHCTKMGLIIIIFLLWLKHFRRIIRLNPHITVITLYCNLCTWDHYDNSYHWMCLTLYFTCKIGKYHPSIFNSHILNLFLVELLYWSLKAKYHSGLFELTKVWKGVCQTRLLLFIPFSVSCFSPAHTADPTVAPSGCV